MGIRTISIVSAALLLCAAGSASAQVVAMPNALTFADTGTGSQSAAQTLTFTNNGNVAANVQTITLAGANPGDFVLTNFQPPPPVTLGQGVSMSVDVIFAPTAINQRTATVSAALKMGGSVDVPVSGKGIGPTCTVAPSPIVCGGLLFGMVVPAKVATVSNSGGAQLHVTSVTVGGPDAARFALSGLPGFPKTLGPNASFPVTINFTPIQKGKANATLIVASDDPMNPSLVTTLSGLSGDPQVALDIGTIIFGNARVGQTTGTQDVTITNGGFSDLHVTGIVVNGANPGDFSLTNPPMLPALIPIGGAGIKFTMAFAPTAPGARAAQVSIASDDPATPKLLPLSGTGTEAMAMLSTNKIDFGQVTVLSTGGSNFTISNSGTGVLKVNTLSVSGKDAALFSTKMKAPFTVAPMGSAVVSMSFAPMAIGMFNASVDLTTDDANLPMASIPMTGEGTAAGFAASPLSLSFSSVTVGTSSMAQTVTLSNTGNQPLDIMDMTETGAFSQDFAIGNQPPPMTMIAPNGKVTFNVTFTPSMDQKETAQIDISTNDPKNPSVTILLDGFGTQPLLMVAPPSLTFSAAVGNTSPPQSVTIQNTGDSDLHISTIKVAGAMGGPFACDSQGGFTLAQNKAMKVNVTFTPTAAMPSSAALVIDSSDPGVMPGQVALSGTGVSPMITASPTSIDFGPIPVGSTSAPQTITIRNSGIASLNLDRITAADPQFGPAASGLNMVIMPKATLDLPVTFSPTGTGDFKTLVQFWGKGMSVPAVSVTAQGSGVDAGMMRSSGCALSGRARATALALPAVLLALFGLALRRRRGR